MKGIIIGSRRVRAPAGARNRKNIFHNPRSSIKPESEPDPRT